MTKAAARTRKATTLDEKRKIAEAIQRVEYETVPSVMWGQFTEPAAYRTSLTGVIQVQHPIFWGLDKTASKASATPAGR